MLLSALSDWVAFFCHIGDLPVTARTAAVTDVTLETLCHGPALTQADFLPETGQPPAPL